MVFLAFGRAFWVATVAAIAAVSITGTAVTGTLGGSQASNTATSVQAISGYTISNIAYNLNANTPANVDSVTFTIVNPGHLPGLARVSPNGTWFNCTLAAALPNYNATCATTGWTLIDQFTGTLSVVVRQ